MTEDIDNIWLEVEESTKDFDFNTIKEKVMALPDDGGKPLEPIKNLRGLMKSYIDAQKMVGDPSNRMPKDDDKEGWEKFYQKRGKPETPDGYKFNFPEYEIPEDIMEPITKNLHEANLTNSQAEKVLKTFFDLTAEDSKKAQEAASKQAEELAKAKQVRFADKLDEFENLSKDYIESLDDGPVKEGLKSLAATPEGLAYISELASKTGGDDPAGPSERKRRVPEAKSAQERINELKADRGFINKLLGHDKSIPREAVKSAQELWKTLHEEAVADKKS